MSDKESKFNLFKRKKNKKSDPISDVQMSLIALPTVGLIFSGSALFGDPLLSSVSACVASVITIIGVNKGVRGLSRLRPMSTEELNRVELEKERAKGGMSPAFESGAVGSAIGNAQQQSLRNSETVTEEIKDSKFHEHLKTEQDLAEARQILLDAKESGDKEFSNLFGNDSKTVEEEKEIPHETEQKSKSVQENDERLWKF